MSHINTLSVALCTYNGEAYIKEQLESIAVQTVLPNEVLICDDCSTDGTVALIEECKSKLYLPIRFVKNTTNLGFHKNFEKAISLCSGDIIMLCDQDDIWAPAKIKHVSEWFKLNPSAGALYTNAFLIDERGTLLDNDLWQRARLIKKYQIMIEHGASFRAVFKNNFIYGSTLTINGSYKNHLIPFPDGCSHDRWLSLFFAALDKLTVDNIKLQMYRQHNHQLYGVKNLSYGDLMLMAMKDKNYLNDITMLETLVARVSSVITSKVVFSECRNAIIHLKVRDMMKTQVFIKRLFLTTLELVTLRYHRYSKGFNSFLKDLLSEQIRIILYRAVRKSN